MYENRQIEPANKKDLIEIDALVDGEEKTAAKHLLYHPFQEQLKQFENR